MAFRIINNTQSSLPLSSSLTLPPGGDRWVDQLTFEIARLQHVAMVTVIEDANVVVTDAVAGSLLQDYVGIDPPGNSNGGFVPPSGTVDGALPEWSTSSNDWAFTNKPRNIVLDGGNF